MEKARFEALVKEALHSLPRRFKKHLDNLAVMVEDRPGQSSGEKARPGLLLGLYHGLPYKDRGATYGSPVPDVIVIYQEPIERISSTEEEVRDRIRQVVLHEVGHYFGLSEEELRDIEREEGE
jgi:predicted Zn-dependent protease with MMP-like domain